LSKEALDAFLEIHKEIRLICQLAAQVIKDKEAAKEKFNFQYLREQFTGEKISNVKKKVLASS